MSDEEKTYQKLWNIKQKKLLVSWADHAKCFKWMHSQSHKQYICRNAWLAIPVIIISTITGTANFAQIGLDENAMYLSMVIGSFNILAAIISTIIQFLNVSQKMEGHRIAIISWDKFSRKIQVALANEDIIFENKLAKFITYQEEYDRLIEISPEIANIVIRNFNNMVYSGKLYDIDSGTKCICCYEYICLPFNIEPCCKKKIQRIPLKDIELDLPDICGQIEPTIKDIIVKDKPNLKKLEIYKIYSNTNEKIELDII